MAGFSRPELSAWEFAPGAHAGAYGHGDPTMRFQAGLARHPQLRSALALGTAVWAHGLADRLPDRLEVAIPKSDPLPAALSDGARVARFDANLDYAIRKRVPVHRLETVLVHLATRPNDVRSWSSVEEWLPDVAAADADLIRAELAGRSNAAAVRTGYLLEGLRPELSQELRQHVAGKVWFGPRGRLRRHSESWQVADTILPFRPSQLRVEGEDR